MVVGADSDMWWFEWQEGSATEEGHQQSDVSYGLNGNDATTGWWTIKFKTIYKLWLYETLYKMWYIKKTNNSRFVKQWRQNEFYRVKLKFLLIMWRKELN